MQKGFLLPRICQSIHCLVIILFLIMFTADQPMASETKGVQEFEGLKQRLINDGFDKDRLDTIYSSPKISIDSKGLSRYFVHSESTLDYHQFLSDKSINNALKYMENHKEDLKKAQETYGVDKTIITAILLVETRLGKYVGKNSVINTFSTMAVLSEKEIRESVWNTVLNTKDLTREKFDKKADKKSKWAYAELKAFLKYTKREGIDPVEIEGSYAGAMGFSQFLPSNALTLAKDGNQDNQINLFVHADAIHSIANFLKRFGWKPGITRQKAHKILYNYNRSEFYVDALLKISDRLKG